MAEPPPSSAFCGHIISCKKKQPFPEQQQVKIPHCEIHGADTGTLRGGAGMRQQEGPQQLPAASELRQRTWD